MAVTMFLELPGATTADYDRLNEAMGIRGPEDEPDALISHVCATVDDGLMIFDVWRSQEELESFLETRVLPAAVKIGLTAAQPTFGSLHYQLGTR